MNLIEVLVVGVFAMSFGLLSLFNIINIIKLTKKPFAKINSLNEDFVAVRATLYSPNKNNLIAPLTKRPCCWYSFSLALQRYRARLFKPIDKRSVEAIFEIRDDTGTALLATHHAAIQTSNSIEQYLNSQPNLDSPDSIPHLVDQSNTNILLAAFNMLSIRKLQNSQYSNERIRNCETWSIAGAFSRYIGDYYRVSEDILTDGQEVVIYGWNQSIDNYLQNNTIKSTATIAIDNYLKTNDYKSRNIKRIIYQIPSADFIITDTAKSAIKRYKYRALGFGLCSLVLLIIILFILK